MRIGIGYDIHLLSAGRKFFLGGIEIDHDKGAIAHSDGDVLIHALCDAILGALGRGDIGTMFPDTDPAYKDALSSMFLKEICHIVEIEGYEINNIDSTVILEEPKLGPYKENIKKKISDITGVSLDAINVKAKTNEGVDSIGKKEAVAAHAAVTLKKLTDN